MNLIKRYARRINSKPSHHLVAFLMVIVLCLFSTPALKAAGHGVQVGIIWIMGLLGLTIRPLIKTSQYWFVFAALFGSYVVLDWTTCDNHYYVLVYVLLSLGFTFSVEKEEQENVLRWNAKAIIVLAIGLSVFQKAVSVDFLNGDMMKFLFMSDPRFISFLAVFGIDMTQVVKITQAHMLRLLQEPQIYFLPIVPPLVDKLARWLTWSVFIFESAVTVAFCLFHKPWMKRLAHTLFISFIIGVYFFLPVMLFGMLLCLLGLATTSKGEKVRWAYGAALCFLIFNAGVFTPENPLGRGYFGGI